jgi:hypothetical protein
MFSKERNRPVADDYADDYTMLLLGCKKDSPDVARTVLRTHFILFQNSENISLSYGSCLGCCKNILVIFTKVAENIPTMFHKFQICQLL